MQGLELEPKLLRILLMSWSHIDKCDNLEGGKQNCFKAHNKVLGPAAPNTPNKLYTNRLAHRLELPGKLLVFLQMVACHRGRAVGKESIRKDAVDFIQTNLLNSFQIESFNKLNK